MHMMEIISCVNIKLIEEHCMMKRKKNVVRRKQKEANPRRKAKPKPKRKPAGKRKYAKKTPISRKKGPARQQKKAATMREGPSISKVTSMCPKHTGERIAQELSPPPPPTPEDGELTSTALGSGPMVVVESPSAPPATDAEEAEMDRSSSSATADGEGNAEAAHQGKTALGAPARATVKGGGTARGSSGGRRRGGEGTVAQTTVINVPIAINDMDSSSTSSYSCPTAAGFKSLPTPQSEEQNRNPSPKASRPVIRKKTPKVRGRTTKKTKKKKRRTTSTTKKTKRTTTPGTTKSTTKRTTTPGTTTKKTKKTKRTARTAQTAVIRRILKSELEKYQKSMEKKNNATGPAKTATMTQRVATAPSNMGKPGPQNFRRATTSSKGTTGRRQADGGDRKWFFGLCAIS